MSSEVSAQIIKKDGSPKKSMNPPKKFPLLLKNKGKSPPFIQKNNITNNRDNDINGEGINSDISNKKIPPKLKAMKPKIKIPEPKFKTLEMKSDEKPSNINNVQNDMKKMMPKLKSIKPKIKIPEPKFKSLEQTIKKEESCIKSTGSNKEPPKSIMKQSSTYSNNSQPILKRLQTSKKKVSIDLVDDEDDISNEKNLNKNSLFKNKYYEKINILDKLKSVSSNEINKNESNVSTKVPMGIGKIYYSIKEKGKAYQPSLSSSIKEKTITNNGTASLSQELEKNIGNNHHMNNDKMSKNDLSNDILNNSNNSAKRMSMEKISNNDNILLEKNNTNIRQMSQSQIKMSNTYGENILVGIKANKSNVGPLTTLNESKLIQDTHYINAFSRYSGNYVGKVTGPAHSISNLDKTPQNINDKKRCVQNDIHKNGCMYKGVPPPFYDYPYMMNYPYCNNMLYNGAMDNHPFYFYPGFYVPMYPYDYSYNETLPFFNNENIIPNGDDTSDISKSMKKNKRGDRNKQKGINKKCEDNMIIAGGHLKPLQFRNGAEWNKKNEKKFYDEEGVYYEDDYDEEDDEYYDDDDEDEEYNNEDKLYKEQHKINNKYKSSYIGNSKWYEIEHKLNNCRGVIEEDKATKGMMKKKKKKSVNEKKAYYEDETKYYDEYESEYSNPYDSEYNDTYLSDDQLKNKNMYKNGIYNKRRLNNRKQKHDLEENTLEDTYNFNFDDIYKNYKIEYLNEKLKWANENLKKKKNMKNMKNKKNQKDEIKIDQEETNDCGPTEGTRKKNVERLEDIAHLFLPKQKKHDNMFNLSLNISKMSNNDKDDIINMLFSCRELEKLIEEQHCVLDMLDNDLREVNASLKLPATWDNLENFELLQENILKEEEHGLPLNNTPFFIKGKVALIPKDINTFFDDEKKGGLIGKKDYYIKNVVQMATQVNTPTPVKYVPKFTKAKVKPKVPLLLKNNAKA
ncbi:conserved Plasmodium protein, unknown function [Plasmodium sp. gorilla clade G2]|uniref:conserved Plasmodium protein, unknown function n=1 Tax=Plasmodium sp. gorilla clade G2 TaxID=880535 RepID=UPI000D212468|nr:conserved Plasmodium protein, unknown function [Plasmodium sp. gorilla clade G2]SOV13680.1 conserved Plasmodium protein, unknown function [Plasmodium sp. gorilla clade G2]